MLQYLTRLLAKKYEISRALLANLPGVEVVDFKLGFERIDPKTGCRIKYFVAKWIGDAIRLDFYLETASKKKVESLGNIVASVEHILDMEGKSQGVNHFLM